MAEIFNPLDFVLRIQYIYDSGIYYTVVNMKEIDAPTIEELFERVACCIKLYNQDHALNDTD